MPDASVGPRWRRLWPLAVILGLALVLGLHTFVWPFGRDQGIEGTTGWLLLRGHMPYRDFWSNSPPAGFLSWAFGFAVFGVRPIAVRLIDWLWIAGTGVGVGWLIRRWTGKSWLGVLGAAALLVSYYARVDFWHSAQRDSLMLFPSVWAVVLATYRTRTHAMLAGVMVGIATLYKPGGAAMILPVIACLWPRRGLVLVSLGGGAGVALFLVGWLTAGGAWPGFMEGVVEFNRGYAAHYAEHSDSRLMSAIVSVAKMPLLERPELALGVLGLTAVKEQRRVLAAWLLAAVASVLTQAALYPYHFFPLLPPLAVGVALSVEGLPSRTSNPQLVRRLLCVLAVLGVVGALPWWFDHASTSLSKVRGTLSDAEYSERFAAAGDYEVIARHVRELSHDGDTVYLWASDAQLHLLTERDPAHRYLVNFPVVAPWGAKDRRGEIVNELEQTPPEFVVVRNRDFMPWLNGHRGDSVATMQEFPELLGFLQRNYQQVVSTDYLLLLRRKTARPLGS